MQSPWHVPAHPGGAAAPSPPAPLQQMSPGPALPEPLSALDAVRFVFRSNELKNNLLFGSVLLVIPIAGPLCFAGWMCETHQRLLRRHPDPLPKFDFGDFGHYLTRGVAGFLVGLLFMFPALLVSYGIGAAGGFGAVALMATTEEVLFVIALIAGLAVFGFLFWTFMLVLLYAAQTRAELTEDFGASFKLGEIWSYASKTWGKVLVKSITFGFLSFGIMLIGMLACYIGLYPALVVIQIASMHLRQQIYQHYLAGGGTPIPLKAPQWLPSELQRMQHGYAR